MNRNLIAGIVVVIIVIAGGTAYYMSSHKASAPSTSSGSPTSSQSTDNSTGSTASGSSFTVNANDESADVTNLNVKKGDTVTVTFNVEENGTYHGGLQFESDVVNSKPILPGKSDTVSFTADKSFDFIPYWYQSSIKKDYVISVHVN